MTIYDGATGEQVFPPVPQRKITFYADPEIAEWYDSLPRHAGSATINQFLKERISRGTKRAESIDDRLLKLETLVGKLVKEQSADAGAIDDLTGFVVDLGNFIKRDHPSHSTRLVAGDLEKFKERRLMRDL